MRTGARVTSEQMRFIHASVTPPRDYPTDQLPRALPAMIYFGLSTRRSVKYFPFSKRVELTWLTEGRYQQRASTVTQAPGNACMQNPCDRLVVGQFDWRDTGKTPSYESSNVGHFD
jgi:hypothetical protein